MLYGKSSTNILDIFINFKQTNKSNAQYNMAQILTRKASMNSTNFHNFSLCLFCDTFFVNYIIFLTISFDSSKFYAKRYTL